MKARTIFAATAIAGGGALTIAMSPAGAAGPPGGFTCTGTLTAPEPIPAGAYRSLAMPAGSLCAVVGDVTVTHPLKIGAGAGLAVLGGSLTVHGPVDIHTGGVLASLANTTPVHLAGPVNVGQDAALILGVETPGGPIVNSVGGPVQGDGGSSVQIHNAESARLLPRHLGDRDGRVRAAREMRLDHRPVVHAVDVIPREHEQVLRLALLDPDPVLLDGVRGAPVPVGLRPSLKGLQELHAAALSVQVPGASNSNMVAQAQRAVLREDAHVVDSRVHAVGE